MLLPGTPSEVGSDAETRQFLNWIARANDLGIQALLLKADRDDILALLKAAEQNERVLDRFYANMSVTSRKIFAEDLTYKFGDDVPPARINTAIGRLAEAARVLERDGALTFGG